MVEYQQAAADLRSRSHVNHARGNAVPWLEALGRTALADQDRFAVADQVARQKRSARDNVADLIEAHRRFSQRRHVVANRGGFFPAAALEIVIGRVLAVEFTGQEVLESAGPHHVHEQIFADGRSDLLDLDAGFFAGGGKVIFKDPVETIGPSIARRPPHQPFEHVFAGHVPARTRNSRSRPKRDHAGV
ncbi:hypothetical protein [Bradyrhizobium sp. 1]|uniref:hypothetical protein n=1 Tax=Bradyrhizobium sp. 1 TaxID=241591 RepID=UPI001FFBF788|nr:hypothetical protein [Bradyrhizobium sp. 1]